jgi:hypothetical protein
LPYAGRRADRLNEINKSILFQLLLACASQLWGFGLSFIPVALNNFVNLNTHGYIDTYLGRDYRRGMDWILELQAVTTPPLITTLYSSLHRLLSLFQPAMSSRTVPWQRLLTVEILQLPTLRSYLSNEYSGTRMILLITFRHEPHRKHRFHFYSATIPRTLHVPVAARTRLPSGCWKIARVFLTSLPAVTKQRLLFTVTAQQRLYTPQYVWKFMIMVSWSVTLYTSAYKCRHFGGSGSLQPLVVS